MSRRNVEKRGYLSSIIVDHGFRIRNFSSFMDDCTIMRDNPTHKQMLINKNLRIGDIVSCVVEPRPINEDYIVTYSLKSMIVSDYKAKRIVGSRYFKYPDAYIFQKREHKLAAFVNKDGEFDYRAIRSFDSKLWGWFTDLDIDCLIEIRRNHTALVDLKFKADIQAFFSAIDKEIMTRYLHRQGRSIGLQGLISNL